MERRVLDGTVVSPRLRLRRARGRGFTLVELAIVVAIVGILAVIAVVGYRKYILNAKINEAKAVIGAVRIAQEAHKAETGAYASISPAGGGNWCPAGAGTGAVKVGWNPACDGGLATWNRLPVHVDGAVIFAYKTVAGNSGKPANTVVHASAPVDFTAAKDGPWYVVGAQCDLDQAGDTVNTFVTGSSHDNLIRSSNDGS